MSLKLAGVRQENGFLEGIERVGTTPHTGAIWKCFCHLCGKNYRNVLARDFTKGRVRKCEACVNPVYRKRQSELVKHNRRVKNAKLRELGPPFITSNTGFRVNLDATLRSFSPRRRLLYETILDGRESIFEYRLQALEWTMQIRECDLDLELRQFNRAGCIERLNV